jgi:hypothetical protein
MLGEIALANAYREIHPRDATTCPLQIGCGLPQKIQQQNAVYPLKGLVVRVSLIKRTASKKPLPW